MKTHHIRYDDLHAFCVAVLSRLGLSEADARRAADVICYADLHGFTTHGSVALASLYAPRLADGRVSTAAASVIVRETPASALIDGEGRLGLLVGAEAMELAIRKARTVGVAAVAVRNSTHFGSAGYYTATAAAQGVIGWAMTNCGSQGVAPPLGGARRMFGTNPISVAVPSGDQPPLVLDMSTTVVATGRLKAALSQQQNVPSSWLRRDDGSFTSDPSEYFAGSADVTWLGSDLDGGAAKGFGLGLLVELLAGVLSGAAVGPNPHSLIDGDPQPDADIGHFFLALDPAAFVGAEEFRRRTDEVLATVSACPPAGWAQRVRYPGQPEAEAARLARAVGVAVPGPVAAALRDLAAWQGLEPPPGAAEGPA